MDSASKLFFLLIIYIILISSYAENKIGLNKFKEGNVDFTGKFLYEATKSNPGVSLIISPFSVLFLLAQLALYATGNSLHQLLNLLNLATKTRIRSVIPNYLDTLNAQQNVTFDLAEKIYANIQYELRPSFKRDSKNIFKGEAQNLDFCKRNEAAKTINDWVASKTNDLIKDLVSPDSLDCNTVLVLTNAIYFKGDWKHKFNPRNTDKKDFYVNKNKTVQVNMMKQRGYFKYADIDYPHSQVIELPYESDNFSLLVWLPIHNDGIDDMINDIGESLSCSLSNVISSLTYNNVDISMPTIETSTTTDLEDILKKANVTAIFNAKTAGLSRILQSPRPISVTSAVQKAAVVVNESGSEAAAGNAISVGGTAAPESTTEFNANHPFVYFILFQGTPIFCGSYYADNK